MSPATAIHATISGSFDSQQIAKRPSGSDKTPIVATAPQSFTKGKKIPKGKIGFDTSGVSESITKILGSLNNTNSNLLPRSKKGINEKILKKELSTNDEVVEDIIDLISEMIIDKLIPAHLIKNTTQRDLYANKFSIVESSNIVLGGTDKKVLTINVADEYDLKSIRSLNLLEQFDYNTYKIDEVVVKLDTSGKLKGKLTHIKMKLNKKQKQEERRKEGKKKKEIKNEKKSTEDYSDETAYEKYANEISSTIHVDSLGGVGADHKLRDKKKESGKKINLSIKSQKNQRIEDDIKELFEELQGLRNEFEKKILALLSLLEERYPGYSDRKELS